jgi:Zn-dependent protease with chaperone function
MYELLAISLALTALLTVNAVASLAVGSLWRPLRPALLRLSASTRGEILFTLRILPPAVALVAVAAVLVPSFIAHEPQATGETVGPKLAALTAISAAGVALAVTRAARSWWATRSLLHNWLRAAQRIEVTGVTARTFKFSHEFPILAVVGTIRPRLFIAERVLTSLTPEELTAAIAHECGHLNARDNLKRLLLRVCRDLWIVAPFGRSLDRAWAESAEAAADEFAAQRSAQTALDLASALLKIARMVPAKTQVSLPLAAFLVGVDEEKGVKVRVRRLLVLASLNGHVSRTQMLAANVLPVAAVSAFVAAGVAAAFSSHVLVTAHGLMEFAVRLLS